MLRNSDNTASSEEPPPNATSMSLNSWNERKRHYLWTRSMSAFAFIYGWCKD